MPIFVRFLKLWCQFLSAVYNIFWYVCQYSRTFFLQLLCPWHYQLCQNFTETKWWLVLAYLVKGRASRCSEFYETQWYPPHLYPAHSAWIQLTPLWRSRLCCQMLFWSHKSEGFLIVGTLLCKAFHPSMFSSLPEASSPPSLFFFKKRFFPVIYFLLHAFNFGVHKRILSSNTFNDDAASLLNSSVSNLLLQ